MKLAYIITTLIMFVPFDITAQPVTLEEARTMYFNLPATGCNAFELARKFEKSPPTSNILSAYFGASSAAAPACITNPMKKISYFNKGKRLLADAVNRDITSYEIRFLRFATQTKSPGFLGYKDKIKEDKQFLIDNISSVKVINNEMVINNILTFIVNSEYTTQTEKKTVTDFLKSGRKKQAK